MDLQTVSSEVARQLAYIGGIFYQLIVRRADEPADEREPPEKHTMILIDILEVIEKAIGLGFHKLSLELLPTYVKSDFVVQQLAGLMTFILESDQLQGGDTAVRCHNV